MLILMRQLKIDKLKIPYVRIKAYSTQVRHAVDHSNVNDHTDTATTGTCQQNVVENAICLLRESETSTTYSHLHAYCQQTKYASCLSDTMLMEIWRQNEMLARCSNTAYNPSSVHIASEVIPLGILNDDRLSSSISCYKVQPVHHEQPDFHYFEDVISHDNIRLHGGRSSLLHEDQSHALQCSETQLETKRNLQYAGENSPVRKTPGNNSQLPSQEQLDMMRDNLADNFPRLFVKRHDYRIYRNDLIFENNFREKPITTVGLTAYVLQVAKLRFYIHFRYANARLSILKITTHTSDGSVRVRWRIYGIPQLRAFMFWKFLPWTYKKALTTEAEWVDGFSTFYVGSSDGLILKHKLDKVIPDEDVDVAKDKKLAEKLGLAAQ